VVLSHFSPYLPWCEFEECLEIRLSPIPLPPFETGIASHGLFPRVRTSPFFLSSCEKIFPPLVSEAAAVGAPSPSFSLSHSGQFMFSPLPTVGMMPKGAPSPSPHRPERKTPASFPRRAEKATPSPFFAAARSCHRANTIFLQLHAALKALPLPSFTAKGAHPPSFFPPPNATSWVHFRYSSPVRDRDSEYVPSSPLSRTRNGTKNLFSASVGAARGAIYFLFFSSDLTAR